MSSTEQSLVLDRPLPYGEAELRWRLAELAGAFWLRDGDVTYAGAFPTEFSASSDPEPALPLDPERPRLPRWVGVLPYEAFREAERGAGTDERPAALVSQICWARYPAVIALRDGSARLWADSSASSEQLLDALQAARPPMEEARLTWAMAPEAEEIHRERIKRALGLIAEGDLYQVNLARRFQFDVAGAPLTVLSALGALAEAPFAAALSLADLGVVSASPELFLDLRPDRRVVTRPIKGTRPRGASPSEDGRLIAELDASEKERAELAMVIDIERSDLGRVCEVGSVRMSSPPAVVTYPTVHHREAEVEARLRPDVSRAELLRVMLPSGSVTGAPKIRAMERICQLEAHRRGLYTGCLGYLGQDGGLRLSMAIRVLTMRAGRAHYFAGGGIVADSDPEEEVRETLWKAQQLSGLVGIS